MKHDDELITRNAFLLEYVDLLKEMLKDLGRQAVDSFHSQLRDDSKNKLDNLIVNQKGELLRLDGIFSDNKKLKSQRASANIGHLRKTLSKD